MRRSVFTGRAVAGLNFQNLVTVGSVTFESHCDTFIKEGEMTCHRSYRVTNSNCLSCCLVVGLSNEGVRCPKLFVLVSVHGWGCLRSRLLWR